MTMINSGLKGLNNIGDILSVYGVVLPEMDVHLNNIGDSVTRLYLF